MKKTTLFIARATFFLISLITIPEALEAGEDSSDSKIAALVEEYTGGTPLEEDTVAPPLQFFASETALAAGPRLAGVNLSLLALPHTAGTQGDLLYESVEGVGLRLHYQNLEEEAAFFWLFEESMDLRNRWVRIRYSGLRVPARARLRFDHAEGRLDSDFLLYFDNTLASDTIFFKLPDRPAFASIETLRLVIDPKDLETRHADFFIHDLELLPEDEDPLGEEPSDLTRFEWYARPLKAENQATFNTHYTF